MRINSLKGYLVVVSVSAVSFWIFNFISDHPRDIGFGPSSNGTALVDNSLINRFSGVAGGAANSQKAFDLSVNTASYATISLVNKKIIFYDKGSGRIESIQIPARLEDIDARSSYSTLEMTAKPGAKAATWSQNGKSLILYFDSGLTLYDLDRKTSKNIDGAFLSPSFSPSGDQIGYLSFTKNATGGEVRLSGSDFGAFKSILKTRLRDWQISWPTADALSLFKPKSSAAAKASLFSLASDGSAFKRLLSSADLIDFSFSPNGARVLYSYYDPAGKATLAYIDVETGNTKDIGLSTLASKCKWGIDNSTIFCAGPSQGMDADSMTKNLDDSFTVIDVTKNTISKKLIASSSETGPLTAANLFTTSLENYLVFIDLQSNKIKALPISR